MVSQGNRTDSSVSMVNVMSEGLIFKVCRQGLAASGLGLLISACTPAAHPQSADDAYQACLSRARLNDLSTRDGGQMSLQRGFPSDRRRDSMDALPAIRSQTPVDCKAPT
jgi:hypothetical protein